MSMIKYIVYHLIVIISLIEREFNIFISFFMNYDIMFRHERMWNDELRSIIKS